MSGTQEKLQQLMARCKGGLYLTVNDHKSRYQSVADFLMEVDDMPCPPSIDQDIKELMIINDSIISLTFYPHTPVGSYDIYHSDLESALDMALSCL